MQEVMKACIAYLYMTIVGCTVIILVKQVIYVP